MTYWGELAARARGLATRLLHPEQLGFLAAARTLAELASRLTGLGLVPAGDFSLGTPFLERHLLERYVAVLDLLADWAGERQPLLAPLFEEDACHALRQLLRAVAAGVAPSELPSMVLRFPGSPGLKLGELAAQPDLASVAALLIRWDVPYGSAVAAQAERQEPDLLALETALVRTWAARAVPVARRAGPAMEHYVTQAIDWHNAETALLLAARSEPLDPSTLFVDGGKALDAGLFYAAAGATSASRARSLLEASLRRTPLRALPGRPWLRSEPVLAALGQQQRLMTRQDPLGIAPVIWLVLSFRLETLQLRRLIWGVAMSAPEQRLVPRARALL
jgi:vacuolar-type H+-ATPase subunit C/Vma6